MTRSKSTTKQTASPKKPSAKKQTGAKRQESPVAAAATETRRSRSNTQAQKAMKEPKKVAAAAPQKATTKGKDPTSRKATTSPLKAAVKRAPSLEERKQPARASPPKSTTAKNIKAATKVKEEVRGSSQVKKERVSSSSRQASMPNKQPSSTSMAAVKRSSSQASKGAAATKRQPSSTSAKRGAPQAKTTKAVKKEEVVEPKVEIKVGDLKTIDTTKRAAPVVKQEPTMAVKQEPVAAKAAVPKKEEIPDHFPIKSGFDSRFELEQEIERQFAFGMVKDEDVMMKEDAAVDARDNFYSQPNPTSEEKSARYHELKKKFDSAAKQQQFKFTPTFSQVTAHRPFGAKKTGKMAPTSVKTANLISYDQITKLEEGEAAAQNVVKQEEKVMDLQSLPQQDRVLRRTPSAQQDFKAKQDAKKQPQFALSGAAFGAPAAAPGTHQEHKAEKKKQDKILMNEQNWQLAQDRQDVYIPNKLPFFRPEGEEQTEGKNEAEQGLLKLNRVKSQVSVEKEFAGALDPDVDTEVRDMIYNGETGQISCSNHEALLLQLPGTLPFAEIKPHSATALEEMIDRLSEQQQHGRGAPPSKVELMSDSEPSSGAGSTAEPPKIGKLRIHKSGKVVMRVQLPGQDSYVDLELNKGIQTNFYQELVSVNSASQDIHFLAPVSHKIVATPDLDSILNM